MKVVTCKGVINCCLRCSCSRSRCYKKPILGAGEMTALMKVMGELMISQVASRGIRHHCGIQQLTFILLMWRNGRAPNSIPIYSYIQQGAKLHILFISGNCSTCFGWYFHPLSGAHTTVSTASGICHTVTFWIYLRCTNP
jgi:hypothetical protein